MDFISIGLKLLSMVFPLFKKNDIPRLEIDFDRSELFKNGIIVYKTRVKVFNHSAKNAYDIEVFINNGANKFSLKRDAMKPADHPMIHDSTTEVDKAHYYQKGEVFDDYFVIVQYSDEIKFKDGKQNTYYSIRLAKDESSQITEKRPKELDDFYSKVDKKVLYKRL